MLPALPLLWNVIFSWHRKTACVVSEEYLDIAFRYLREVLVSVQINHHSNMFTTNDFVNFLGICPAGHRMARAPLELNWQQQCLSPAPPPHPRSEESISSLGCTLNSIVLTHLFHMHHQCWGTKCKIIPAGWAAEDRIPVNDWGVQRAFLNSTPSYSFARTKQKGKVQKELCCVTGFFSNKQKCCWVFHFPWKFARKQGNWGEKEILKIMYPKLFLCYLYKAFASVTAC